MFSFFKKNATPTFKVRVHRFWDWYISVAERFYKTIEANHCADLTGEVSEKIDELLPGMGWVFGPGENGVGHSFTLTGEGVISKQLLCEYWRERAPALTGWTFYDSRHPAQYSADWSFKMDDRSFRIGDLRVTPSVNEEKKCVDIVAWHPIFEQCERKLQATALFLFLDELLGERGTEVWIGGIEIDSATQSLSMPPNQLKGFITAANQKYEWKKDIQKHCGSVYQIKISDAIFPRSDVYCGSTINFRLIADYVNAKGSMGNPISGLGADYVFVAFDNRILELHNESHSRGEIEDLLDDALRAEWSGRSIGGAMSAEKAYIDLIITDGANSIDIIRRVAKQRDCRKEQY